MRARTCVITCCALVLLGAFTAATVAATPLDKRTTFTFSAPFTVPGVTLPAGTYIFRLADDLRGCDIVQVLGAENGVTYAMFHTLRTPRGIPVDKPELRFLETATDMPIAVRSWWYPAETQGYEFLYPRDRAAHFPASLRESSALRTVHDLGNGRFNRRSLKFAGTHVAASFSRGSS
jgi:hypothetical protein